MSFHPEEMAVLETPAAPSRSLRHRIVLVIKIVVSVALLALLIATAGLRQLEDTLSHAQPGWLISGLALGVLAAGLQANQWKGLLGAFGVRRSLAVVLRLDTAARFFDAVLPTSIGGDVVRVGLGARTPSERAPVGLAVVLRRVLQVPGLLLVMAVGLAASWHLSYSGRLRVTAGALLLAGMGGVLVLLVLRSSGIGSRLPQPRPLRKLIDLWQESRALELSPGRPFLRASARGVLFWVTVCASQLCYVRAVHVHTPVAYTFCVIATVNMVSMLPISLGGYGLREGAFSALLAVGGLGTTSQGAAVGVCLSAQTLIFGLVGGLVWITVRQPGGEPHAVLHPGDVLAVGG